MPKPSPQKEQQKKERKNRLSWNTISSWGVILLLTIVNAAWGNSRRLQSIFEEWSSEVMQQEDDNDYFSFARDEDVNASLYKYYYPVPVPNKDAEITLRPILGRHRKSHNAVMTFMFGYQIQHIILFIRTLYATGYTGDLVIAMGGNISNDTQAFLHDCVMEYPIVVYDIHADCRRNYPRGNICWLTQSLYGTTNVNGTIIPLPDTRGKRHMAMIRFEVYWVWTTKYHRDSQLLYLDARDSYFQRDPFVGLVPNATTLHVFEEHGLVRQSFPSSNWLRKQYPNEFEPFLKKHVVCSGSTMGGQPAMETYSRAMVYQADKYDLRINGGDQGHHEYLVRSNRLVGAPNISHVIIHPRGEGQVNTVGLLWKLKGSLKNQGVLDNSTHEVLNTDRSASPVVHMFDRDPEIRAVMANRTSAFVQEWKLSKSTTTTKYLRSKGK